MVLINQFIVLITHIPWRKIIDAFYIPRLPSYWLFSIPLNRLVGCNNQDVIYRNRNLQKNVILGYLICVRLLQVRDYEMYAVC